MLYYISLIIIGWLFVGFSMGLKFLLIDRIFDRSHKYFEPTHYTDHELQAAEVTDYLLKKNKLTFLSVVTLSGALPLFVEIFILIKNLMKK